MEKFFKLKENKTDLSTELMAGYNNIFCYGIHNFC